MNKKVIWALVLGVIGGFLGLTLFPGSTLGTLGGFVLGGLIGSAL